VRRNQTAETRRAGADCGCTVSGVVPFQLPTISAPPMAPNSRSVNGILSTSRRCLAPDLLPDSDNHLALRSSSGSAKVFWLEVAFVVIFHEMVKRLYLKIGQCKSRRPIWSHPVHHRQPENPPAQDAGHRYQVHKTLRSPKFRLFCATT
jgi:hypothetical protein